MLSESLCLVRRTDSRLPPKQWIVSKLTQFTICKEYKELNRRPIFRF